MGLFPPVALFREAPSLIHAAILVVPVSLGIPVLDHVGTAFVQPTISHRGLIGGMGRLLPFASLCVFPPLFQAADFVVPESLRLPTFDHMGATLVDPAITIGYLIDPARLLLPFSF